MLGSWVVLLTFYWLYQVHWKTIWPFTRQENENCIVHDDGSLLGINHWGRRAAHKLRYIIPILGQAWGLWDVYKTWRHETKRSPVDLANHTVAAVDWSLPVNTRNGLR